MRREVATRWVRWLFRVLWALGVVAVRGAVFVFILSFYLFADPIADTALIIYSMAQALKPVAERFMTPLPSRRASATAY
jgi:magnesium-transporting ATPase (P-type)